MKIFIKYMVSVRCKMVVMSELDNMGIQYSKVDLGEVLLKETINNDQHALLKAALQKSGLELMDDRKAILIERIKNTIIEMILSDEETDRMNISAMLSEKLDADYSYLANLFSEVTGMTIERYLIANKIERVKELLLYHDYSLTDISFMLKYSSVAHLSGQFKKITGLTPTFYRKLRFRKPPPGDNV